MNDKHLIISSIPLIDKTNSTDDFPQEDEINFYDSIDTNENGLIETSEINDVIQSEYETPEDLFCRDNANKLENSNSLQVLDLLRDYHDFTEIDEESNAIELIRVMANELEFAESYQILASLNEYYYQDEHPLFHIDMGNINRLGFHEDIHSAINIINQKLDLV